MRASFVCIAESLMRLAENMPSCTNWEMNEVFRQSAFIEGTEAERLAIMMRSAAAKYHSELNYSWDNYFGIELAPHLAGQRALDLGCFTGGRSVAWYEKNKLVHITGIDVDPIYVEAATRFAESRRVAAAFHVAQGEHLPFGPDSFDAVLSFDVFEHVRNIETTLAECHRVLRPKGKLFVVFPGFYHPLEHHLTLATHAPCIHYVFPGHVLIRAYNRILDSRGRDSYWYKRSVPTLAAWERGNTINGTTVAQFRTLIRDRQQWKVILHSRPPIGSIGRTVARERRLWHRALSIAATPLVRVPILEELFLHRIAFILQKCQRGGRMQPAQLSG